MGCLSVAAGLIILSYPGISLLVLATIVAVWLLIFGVGEIFLAFQLRGFATATSRTGPGRASWH